VITGGENDTVVRTVSYEGGSESQFTGLEGVVSGSIEGIWNNATGIAVSMILDRKKSKLTLHQ
jgi:hypothetical protein